ncbi:MFS transporter [Pseudonocardia sp. CA-107938]|uniref:MFS transporter n=1 Tax=Pseudonocardia sp. CA-107938 TaxID=3240021 RepID=UPI003D949E67
MSSSPQTGSEPVTAPSTTSLTLAIIVSCELMLMLDGTITNVALPMIGDGLGFTPAGLSWVTNAFLLAFGGLLLLGGRAGDILGRRRVFLVGIGLFTAASLLAGLAQTPWQLVVARAAQGAGAALAGPSTLALLTTSFTGEHRTKALGVYSSVTASAMTLGLILGGVITTLASWRWVLLINVPIGVLVLLLAPRHVAESPRHGGRFDLAGALTSAIGVVAVVYALVRTADHGWADPTTLVTLVAGAALLAGFVLVERRAAQPIMPLRLLAERTRAVGFAIMLLVPMVTMSFQFLVIQFLQLVLDLSPLQAGLAFLPMAAGLLVTSRTANGLLGRFGTKPTAAAGLLLLTAAAAWSATISTATTYLGGILGPMLLIGLALGLVIVPINVAIMSTVDPQDAGAASGVLQTTMMTGAALGIAVLSAIYAATVGSTSAVLVGDDAVALGMRHGFVASTVIAALALAVTLAGYAVRERQSSHTK